MCSCGSASATSAIMIRSSWPRAWRGLLRSTPARQRTDRAGARSPGTACCRARHRLSESGVGAVVAASRRRPRANSSRSSGWDACGSRGSTAEPWAIVRVAAGRDLTVQKSDGLARLTIESTAQRSLVVTRDLGPRMDGPSRRRTGRFCSRNGAVFMNIEIQPGEHELILKYDPAEVRFGLMVSAGSAGSCDSGVDRNSIVLDSWNNHRKGAWTDPSPRVRIDVIASSGLVHRLITTEGCIADGPLHVRSLRQGIDRFRRKPVRGQD